MKKLEREQAVTDLKETIKTMQDFVNFLCEFKESINDKDFYYEDLYIFFDEMVVTFETLGSEKHLNSEGPTWGELASLFYLAKLNKQEEEVED